MPAVLAFLVATIAFLAGVLVTAEIADTAVLRCQEQSADEACRAA